MDAVEVGTILKREFGDEDGDPFTLDDESYFWGEAEWSLRKPREYDGATFSTLDSYGGEGQGETRWVVFQVESNGAVQYFRKDGYYASYDGSTWDGEFREVKAVDRTVTFYE